MHKFHTIVINCHKTQLRKYCLLLVSGTQTSSEIREMVFENIIEPPQTLGVLGLETWFITQFTLEEHPQFAIYLGLQGEENRELIAESFKRPTTWLDYCTEVSANNCSIPDNVTQRPPQSNTDEEAQYYNEGNYIGHFRYTEDNDCDLHPTTCTGHVADFPCNWDSFVQSQIKYLNMPLKSSGPEEPIGGYTYPRLVELWKAANATRSNLIMHYWTPEPLVQEFVDTDAEFIRITMPPPSQLCADSRRPEKYQCSDNTTLRYGVEEGVCEESAKNLYKLVVGNLYDITYNDEIPEPIRSPAYDALRLFQLSELQLGQIFDYLHKSSSLPHFLGEHNTNGTSTSIARSITARDAVCHWVIENLDILHTFVPRTYPRTIHPAKSSNNGNTSESTGSDNILNSDKNVLSTIAIILGCIATALVVFMWYMVYKNRTFRAIRFAQIEFLYLLLAGLLLVAVGSILVGLKPSNATCITIIWFINFGYTLEFVPLIVKVAAVNKLIGSARRFRRVVLSRRSLFSAVLAISAIVFIFLLIWTIYDPPTRNKEYILTDIVNDDGYTIIDVTHFCSSDSAMWDYIAVGWNTLLLLCATVLAFQTRTLQKDFNESQTLAFLIYSHFVFVVLRLITVILQQWSGTTTSVEKLVALRSFLFSLDTIATILIYFVPKFTTAANKNNVDRSSSSTSMNNNDLSSSLRNGIGSSHLREDQMMTSGLSESSRHIHFDSFHSATSTDTMPRSNRYSRKRRCIAKTIQEQESNHDPNSESILSSESIQSDERRQSSQDKDDNEITDGTIVNDVIDSLETIVATTKDVPQDLSSSTTATTTSTTTSADDVTKYTTILVGNIDESYVTGTIEQR